MLGRLTLCIPLLLLLVSGPALADGKVQVVASFSILADFVREVGGERVAVASLVGPDADAHSFQPSPADARRIRDAKVVVVNGLGFDSWTDRLLRAAGTRAAIVVASAGVKPLREEASHGHGHDHHADHDTDPHAWQDVANAKLYVANIRDGLAKADPEGRAAYEANAARYLERLEELDRGIRAGIGAIPPGRREVITTHDAFGYFGKAYGLTFTAPQGVSTGGEAKAADIARIIRQVKARRIPAVFLENVSDPRLADRIAAESGAKIGGRLHSDALSAPGGPAPTYLDMMRANLAALRAALAE
ncbi:metal ABC transporter solute-binding protein, Zn/Mn family [Enterovirga aerilata]|uniref:Zinc ABC transporter solute-binding protein n=1 Tax=Enterovirga aerilata TaxID=2730920 RepID=A0A849IE88_9HYPH|nr:zinc ABC transporter substrate-binding protein [Enterovirga sp. DB1703]NNM74287.1 zinc ABC transporter solute-binding protein [Enterovirga sp. DB1703]